MSVRRERRERKAAVLASAMLDLLETYPIRGIGGRMVADATGLTVWAVQRSFPRLEGLAALAVSRLVADIISEARRVEVADETVHGAIKSYVSAVAEIMQGPEYRRLVRILLRDGSAYPWVREFYQERLLAEIGARLREIVSQAGRRYGAELVIRDEAPNRFIRRLEAAFVISQMLPDAPAISPGEKRLIIDEVAGEILASVFDWNMLVAV